MSALQVKYTNIAWNLVQIKNMLSVIKLPEINHVYISSSYLNNKTILLYEVPLDENGINKIFFNIFNVKGTTALDENSNLLKFENTKILIKVYENGQIAEQSITGDIIGTSKTNSFSFSAQYNVQFDLNSINNILMITPPTKEADLLPTNV